MQYEVVEFVKRESDLAQGLNQSLERPFAWHLKTNRCDSRLMDDGQFKQIRE
jgi:hypothetical protein